MQKPLETPEAVTAGLERYARRHNLTPEALAELQAGLGWDALCGCYFFWVGRLFHGVELDGHIHT